MSQYYPPSTSQASQPTALPPDEQPFFSRPVESVENPYAQFRPEPQAAIFDADLVKKYDRQGPRYTSYPTALSFAAIGEGVEAKILANKDPSVPLSLYIHIPFCRHLCYYCGCNKLITKKNADANDYLPLLYQEIRQKATLLSGKPVVEQLHLGGGTPTFLTDEQLAELWQFLHEVFTFSDKPTADFAIEIDPRELRPTTLATLRQLGFNRVSFGVQDLNEAVQQAVNRVQSAELIASVMAEARRLGFASVNIDLMYGLPKQSVASLGATVEQIIKLAPDRLSVFNYAHLPERFASQRAINEQDLPSPADKLAMFAQTIEQLTAAGFQYIGIDHFAKPEDSLAVAQREGRLQRNFQGYTTHGGCDLLGFGVSAISQIGADYLQNANDLASYAQAIGEHRLPAVKHLHARLPDLLRRYVIMQLLCHYYVDFKDINARFSVDAVTYFIEEINALGQLQADKLIDMDAKGIRILPKGRLLARNVAMVFDKYLTTNAIGRFSRTV